MQVADAQLDVRTATLGGFVGQLVSSFIWFGSAVIATFVAPATGYWALAFGGMAIFPLTQLLLRLTGHRASLAADNPLGPLAMQIAFTVPIVLPLAGVAALYRLDLFYPACLIVVGAHYLPFVFLYGMKTFAGLAAALVGAGFALVYLAPGQVVLGGWIGGAILLVFAFGLRLAYATGSTDRAIPAVASQPG